MSQLTVTTIRTENSTTPLTLTTGNASGAIVTVQANSDVRVAGILRAANETVLTANLNFDDTLSTKITDPGANVMSFHTAQAERMRIDTSGNVGIGTASPSSRFDVRGGNGTGGISGPTSGTWASRIVMNQDSSGYSGLSVQSRWGDETTPIFEVASGWNGSAAGYYPVYTVSGTGVAVWKSNAGTERMRIDGNGHFVPGATNTYDLGTTSLRWRNIYTQDLHLSNGIGDYTVIEGEEDLFLVNNKSGRSFKFALIEVDPSVVPPKSS